MQAMLVGFDWHLFKTSKKKPEPPDNHLSRALSKIRDRNGDLGKRSTLYHLDHEISRVDDSLLSTRACCGNTTKLIYNIRAYMIIIDGQRLRLEMLYPLLDYVGLVVFLTMQGGVNKVSAGRQKRHRRNPLVGI